MITPLKKTYSATHPYVVERHDQEDGSITYEIWDRRRDTYRRLCSINDYRDSDRWSSEERRPANCARNDAEMIVRALNLNCGGKL